MVILDASFVIAWAYKEPPPELDSLIRQVVEDHFQQGLKTGVKHVERIYDADVQVLVISGGTKSEINRACLRSMKAAQNDSAQSVMWTQYRNTATTTKCSTQSLTSTVTLDDSEFCSAVAGSLRLRLSRSSTDSESPPPRR